MYRILMRNNATGSTRWCTYDHEWEEHLTFWWTQGNMGCDCNRHMEWVRAGCEMRPPSDPFLNTIEATCGDGAYTVIQAVLEDGSVVPLDDTRPPRQHFDLIAHLGRQFTFNEHTFGPIPRPLGLLDHIRKELKEIEARPDDIEEWIDVIILACDGCRQMGYTPQQVATALMEKQLKNEARKWPDWRQMDPNKAIEHDRSGE